VVRRHHLLLGDHDEMLKDLKSQVFQHRTVKFRAIVDGQPGVREI